MKLLSLGGSLSSLPHQQRHYKSHAYHWRILNIGCLALQIDILVVNCSLFNPTPSLSAMIINHFKMRSNIVSYNLGGMGCSAGVIAISLAKELLQVDYVKRTANEQTGFGFRACCHGRS